MLKARTVPTNPLLPGILQTLLAATEKRKEISKQKDGTYLHEGRGSWLPYLLASNRQKHVRHKKLTAYKGVAGDAMISHDQPLLAMISNDIQQNRRKNPKSWPARLTRPKATAWQEPSHSEFTVTQKFYDAFNSRLVCLLISAVK